MKHLSIFLPLFALLLGIISCGEGTEQKDSAAQNTKVERIDTARLLADQISSSARLYTTEYAIHKIVTYSDEKRLRGEVLTLPVNVELNAGDRKIAIPIDVTVKAYIDFANFTADDVTLGPNGTLSLRLPDPKLAVTSTRIDNRGVRQYIDLVRSSFSDAEVLSFARQGADSVISLLDRAVIISSAGKGARLALSPLLRNAGFAPGNVDIDFRPDFKPEEAVLKIETTPNEIQLQK